MSVTRPQRSLGGLRLDRAHLSDEIAAYLRAMVISGKLREGDRIRAEHLADELGVSATPVREALVSLRRDDVVRHEPRRGFVVAPFSIEDLMDLFQVQAYVAGELAARAAKVITDQECDRLGEILTNLDRAHKEGSSEEAEDFDYEFHRRINATGHAAKLVWLLNTMVPYARHVFIDAQDSTKAESRARRSILKALRNREPEEARRAMSQQILESGERMAAHFRSVGLWTDQGTIGRVNEPVDDRTVRGAELPVSPTRANSSRGMPRPTNA